MIRRLIYMVFLSRWASRRAFLFVASVFCMAVVAYVLATGADTEAARDASSNAFWLLGAIAGIYVGGATWDDVTRLKHGPQSRKETPNDCNTN